MCDERERAARRARAGTRDPARVIRPVTLAELQTEGETLGRALPPGAVLTFEGELGAGKTTFIQAIVRGLGVTDRATSPTYALVHRYQGRRGPVFHLDCYRLRSPDEAADLDWESLERDGDAVLVEWPERAAGWLPRVSRRFRLHHLDAAELRGLELL